MSIPEIMGELSGWNLNVSHEQLVKPSSDFVLSIYNACLDQVTGINHTTLHDPIQSALNLLDDPVRPFPTNRSSSSPPS
jgi:kinetochore protein Nuf2